MWRKCATALIAPWLLFAVAAQAAPSTPNARPHPLLVWGDSLSAGYGLQANQGWVILLQQRLHARGLPWRVINGSVSGETTTGGLTRLPAALQRDHPGIVLIELGANDGLRGQPLPAMRKNLMQMIALTRKAGAKPLLFEMRLPSNYGAQFTAAFRQSFHTVAHKTRTTLVPFFLAAIAADPNQFQADGLHPIAAAQPQLLDAVWPSLAPLLQAPQGAATASRSRADP